jgi:ABC-type antimicrobial peptide transport system permease subunit
LIGGSEQSARAAQGLLENALSDEGFDAVPEREILENLLAVQNTYLSTFQSLGALGLLLGTLGLATVQARSVLERRGELALLRAQGFRRARVGWLVLLENISLLIAGLATGVIAALCAILPHLFFAAASIPVVGVLQLLAFVLVIGALTAAVAVRLTLRAPLLASLRGE